MYTQVTFGEFFDRSLAWAKRQRSIEFGEYPNPALNSKDGDWLYEIDNGFSVRIFRWPPHEGKERTIACPKWGDVREDRETFEPRFEKEFREAVDSLNN
jgi:hypothetical protein